MRKDVKNNLSLKIDINFLTYFVKITKPFLTEKELYFYKRIIEDINFNNHPERISSYIELVSESILKSTIKNILK